MREILFRGKRKDNGKWVEGLPIKTYDTEIGKNSVDYANPVPVVLMASGRIVLECGCDEVPFFNTDEYPIVNPETVGQYTGLQDKNGKKIFEHDIVRIYVDFTTMQYVISYDKENARFVVGDTSFTFWSYINTKIEVIGNVHDGGAYD